MDELYLLFIISISRKKLTKLHRLSIFTRLLVNTFSCVAVFFLSPFFLLTVGTSSSVR